MRTITTIFVSLFLLSVAYGKEGQTAVDAQTMTPTPGSSVLSVDSANIIDSTSSFTQVDSSGNKAAITPSSIDTTQRNEFGDRAHKKIDWTNAAESDKYFRDNRKDLTGSANVFTQEMRTKAKDKFIDKNGRAIDNNNPAEFSEEAITKNFSDESKTVRALKFKNELYKEMRAKLALMSNIQCYITRTLNNAFFCPLPGMGTSDFGGGNKDNRDDALNKCNDACVSFTPCVSRKTSGPEIFVNNTGFLLPNPNITIAVNQKTQTKDFTFRYRPEDLNKTLEEFVKSGNVKTKKDAIALFDDGYIRSKVDIVGVDAYGNERKIINKFEYKINKNGGSVKIGINGFYKALKINFYNSYVFDTRYNENVALYGHNAKVKILDIKADIKGNMRYYCPITQFQSDSRKCKGTLKMVDFGSGAYSVCVPSEDDMPSNRNSEDGGYYDENVCSSECFIAAKCVPTYRHISGLNPQKLEQSIFNIDFGCVDDPNNASCTKERCKDMFEKDIQPTTEKVWQKDDKVVQTVTSGVTSTIAPRPKVDFAAEISSNDLNRTELFNEEMKDAAYTYMVQKETFNISNKKVGEIIPPKFAADVRVNAYAGSISFNLLYKPQSDMVDSGTSIYLYPVVELVSIYRPIKTIMVDGRMYNPMLDRNILAKDSIFGIFIASANVVIPFKRVEEYEYYVPSQTSTGTKEYRWVATTGSRRDYLEEYNPSAKRFLAYGPGYGVGSNAISIIPKSDKPWEEIQLFGDLRNIVNTEGMMHVNKNLVEGKIYDFSRSDAGLRANYESYKIYLVASTTPLDHLTISGNLNQTTTVYDSKHSSLYRSQIEPDTVYNDDRVKLFILGPANNRTVFMKIQPREFEERKRAFIFMFTNQ